MRRPLHDLPLERFLLPQHDPNFSQRNYSPVKQGGSLKRPLSPGARPSLLSPAKRRILTQEGIFSPSKRTKIATKHLGSDLGQELGSPVKKLDFGLPKNAKPQVVLAGSASYVGTSPHAKILFEVEERGFDSALASNDVSLSPSKRSSSQPDNGRNSSSSKTISHSPTMVSRVLCRPDRQSIHYPGFDVFQDSHIPIWYSVSSSSSPSEATLDKEALKENASPRRKVQRKFADASDSSAKYGLPVPLKTKSEHDKIRVTPVTPRKTCEGEKRWAMLGTPTPRRSLHGTPGEGLTGLTPLAKIQRRRLMEEEVDEPDEAE